MKKKEEEEKKEKKNKGMYFVNGYKKELKGFFFFFLAGGHVWSFFVFVDTLLSLRDDKDLVLNELRDCDLGWERNNNVHSLKTAPFRRHFCKFANDFLFSVTIT